MNLLPVSQLLRREKDTSDRAKLRDTAFGMLPTTSCGTFIHGITLCTQGSF